ncbi:MAG: hypothetical protein Tsb0019_05750 [Roseibium sp.]
MNVTSQIYGLVPKVGRRGRRFFREIDRKSSDRVVGAAARIDKTGSCLYLRAVRWASRLPDPRTRGHPAGAV